MDRTVRLPVVVNAVGLARRRWSSWPIVGVGAVALAIVLGLAWLDREGLSNGYYAAAVRGMLASPTNLLFASLDPGGFISLDKPPVGYWPQVLSVAVLGFSGVALLLPQVIAGIATVAALWRIVAASHGPAAGALAALTLAVAPIAVAVMRNNTVDSTLALILVLAAGATLRGMSRGRIRWLLLGFALVGVGFNVKMLEAYLIVPALAVGWLVGANTTIGRRLGGLAVAGLVLLAVSSLWVGLVAITPADQRPYIGGSATNSALELALGYNGLDRLEGLGPEFADVGTPGPLRLVEAQLAGQIGWLIPLAIAGAVALVARPLRGGSARAHRRRGAAWLWATWLATGVVFFSVARFWHAHYLVVLAPPVAALVGAGVVALVGAWRRRRVVAALLPIGIGGSVVIGATTVARQPGLVWVGIAIAAVGLLAILGLCLEGVLRVEMSRPGRRAVEVFVGLGLVASIAGAALWSGLTPGASPHGGLPHGGPAGSFSAFGAGGGGGAGGAPGGGDSGAVGNGGAPGGGLGGAPGLGGFIGAGGLALGGSTTTLIRYLEANRGSERWVLAVPDANTAAAFIVLADLPVMAVGGFTGSDPALTVSGFATLVAGGEVRFVLSTGRRAGQNAAIFAWATSHCGKAAGSPVPGLLDCTVPS